jgi:uncharacterized membrane protein YfcA
VELLSISIAALLAAVLTFFTGFGLGTLLLPVCALFMPVDQAIALTAVVHLVNGAFKFALVARHTVWRIVWSFGIPAVAAAFFGAWLLLRISGSPPIHSYTMGGHLFEVTPVKLLIGLLVAAFALLETAPAFRRLRIAPRYFAAGGFISGFFGGLAGMQGALRSAFLVRAGLSKEQFIGTGAAIACLVDITRLGVYLPAIRTAPFDRAIAVSAAGAAIAGALLGSLLLTKVSTRRLETLVAICLVMVGAALAAGLL